MNTFFFRTAAVIILLLSLVPHWSEASFESNASVRAAKIAMDNGVASAPAKDLSDRLRGIFLSNSADEARIAEVIKLCQADPKQAAAIAASATAFEPRGDFAPKMAEAAARAFRSQAPAIAGAVAGANPHDAPRIAGRVARAVPMAASRITRSVAYAVPSCIEGIGLEKRVSRGLETAIIIAVPSVSPPTIMNAAHSGAKKAEREGRYTPVN